jgi:hypothetical protein
MPCFSPLEAYRSLEPNSNGKYPLVFGKESSDTGEKVEVPCGRCHGCRLERSRQWAMRCVHEASLYEDNCFITLTYSPENLPEDGSLHKDHFQKFMKRLRKKYAPKTIRFYMCGEYGEENGRPHFHALLFNHDFSDKTLWSVREDVSLFVSEELNKLWPFGYCIIGDVTFESAAYVARYVMKKVTGDAAEEHYSRVDPESGEITFLTPEYNCMSRRPGLAFDWYEKYKGDLRKDFITLNGRKIKPPKYYDGLYEREDPEAFSQLKADRALSAYYAKKSDHYDRLRDKGAITLKRLKLLKRTLE